MATTLTAPGPRGHFLLGHLPEIMRDILGFMLRSVDQYGDIVSLSVAGRPVYILRDPEQVDYVLVKNAKNFIKTKYFWRHMKATFGEGMVIAEGDHWLRQRRLAAPAFHLGRVESYANTMAGFAEQLTENWTNPNEVRDLHEDFTHLTMKIAGKTLFDVELGAEAPKLSAAMASLMMEIAARVKRPFVIPDGIPVPGNLRYMKAIRDIDEFLNETIRERKKNLQDRGDLLSMLMAVRDEDGSPMSDELLRDEIMGLFIGGHETTASGLSWTFWLLSKHAQVEKKLHEELDRVLGGRRPTPADLRQLPYLEAVVNESLRLYCPSWGIARDALNDCEIGGYPIKAGTIIFISPWIQHRNPKFFPNPEEFRPERWTEGLAQRLPRSAYMPFGGGPRICIGNRFAQLEMGIVIGTLAQRYQFRWDQNHPVAPFPTMSLRPKSGIWGRMEKRTPTKVQSSPELLAPLPA